MNGFANGSARGWTISLALAGSLLIASAQVSLAGNEDRLSFREFKDLNPGMERHATRQMFRAEHRNQRVDDGGRLRVAPIINISNAVPGLSNSAQSVGNQIRTNAVDKMTKALTKNRTAQFNEDGQKLRLGSGIDLDLSSNDRNIALGKNLFSEGASVQINVGGENKTFGAGSMVSAAEYVAVRQALGEGQTVSIDRSGRAVGGTVNLDLIAIDGPNLRASNLVIPANITTSGDFSKHSDFKLLGDLNNYGTLHAMTSGGGAKSGAIRAVDINNYQGATIRSDISSLTLDASGDFNNSGTIEGTGAITIAAGGSVNNRGTVRATTDLNVQASAINNRGLLEATGGNINLNGPSTAMLTVNNSKGTLQALNGAINLRDSMYYGTFDSGIVGGDLLSKEVNLFAGQANANLFVNDLTGRVNQTGLATHIVANTDVLTIGSTCLTGDPTIYNTAGDIVIDAPVLVAENLVYVASGDIIVSDGVSIQAGDSARGYEINMIAGASFVPDVGEGSGAISIQEIGGVELNGKSSKTGGAILFGKDTILSSRPTDLSENLNGDGILLVAFKGKGTTTGSIDLAGATITTGGSGSGTNGDFYALAENAKGDAITTGIIDTTGGSDPGTFGKTGTIGLFTVNLVASEKGQPVIYNAAGNRTSSAFLTGELLNKTGNIVVTDIEGQFDIRAADRLRINAGSLVTLNGQAEALDGLAEIVSNGDIVAGPNGLYKSNQVVRLIANNIGTAASPITVDTPEIESFGNKGILNYVDVVGTGELQIAGISKGTLSFNAPGKVVANFNDFLNAANIIINADALGEVANINGTNSVKVSTITGNILNSNFKNGLSTKTLTLESTSGSIGTEDNRFLLPGGVTTVGAKTETGNIYLQNASGENLVFTELESTAGNVVVDSLNSITLSPIVTAGGFLSVATQNGTLTASGTIKAGTSVNLTNTNGKIAILKDTTIDTNAEADGEGDVTLSVGAATDVPTPLPISNVLITDGLGSGLVRITGGGVSAKSPVNTLNTPESADISINNGFKNKNITFGGNVVITAQ
ncbi:MAG: hypothetical protein SGJ27_09275 [Candidatus Melainabacteria bacterium]|nr:hypothetical protein [Candidatus Melainabacteria bacterium]